MHEGDHREMIGRLVGGGSTEDQREMRGRSTGDQRRREGEIYIYITIEVRCS